MVNSASELEFKTIEFEIIIDSDALGVDYETLVKVETTQPLILSAPIHLSNMDLNFFR